MTKNITLLKFDDIKHLVDREYIDHEVAQWGGTVRLAVMTGEDRDEWEQRMLTWDSNNQAKFNPSKNMRADLVARCWVNEDFERAVSTKQVLELGQKSSVVLDELFDICQKLNKITEEDLEELEKNSEAAQAIDSGTH